MDDDPVVTHLVYSTLRAKGWEVTTAADAMQAVMFAMRTPPDAIVLDINMPGGTGINALRRIKASVKTAMTPVVVASGTTDPDAPATVTGLGAAAFLRKPLDMDELYRTLCRVLGVAPREE